MENQLQIPYEYVPQTKAQDCESEFWSWYVEEVHDMSNDAAIPHIQEWMMWKKNTAMRNLLPIYKEAHEYHYAMGEGNIPIDSEGNPVRSIFWSSYHFRREQEVREEHEVVYQLLFHGDLKRWMHHYRMMYQEVLEEDELVFKNMPWREVW